ncbi:MAG: Hsp20/alpha crystallin family protein [bacterium]|nr:Hsp20/alpha crystallin family protein [bacterium]
MARREKSFFGKIMGGDVTDDQPVSIPVHDESDNAEEELAEEELVDDEGVYEDVETYEVEEVPAPLGEPAQAAAPAASGEEWMSDYEGALNIDMYQTKDNVIIKSTIAGVRPDDIDITVANDMVTIKGTRQREENISQDDYFYQECYWGSFSRSVIVPVDIDSEEIEADLKDGILTVIIPKAAKAKTKKVKVKGM